MEIDTETPELLLKTVQPIVDFFRETTSKGTTSSIATSRGGSYEYPSSSPPPLGFPLEGPDWESHRITLTLTACVAIVIALCGFIGNLLTIISLTSNRGPAAKLRRNSSNLFIVSLSLADLMFSAVNMPFAASRFFHRSWVHGDFLCQLFPFLRYMNVGLSLLSITAITVNRYILIAHRRLYDRIYHKNAILLMIGFTWIFPIVVLIPTWFGRWGKFGYDSTILNCSILEVNGKSPKHFLFVSAFLVPCFTIIICYTRIFWIVHRSKVQMSSHARTSEQQKERETKRKMEEWRVTRMVLVIFCSFLICYMPITLVKVADRGVRYPAVHLLAYTLVYLSACINPIIYGITNQQYRDAYKQTISRMCSGVLQHFTGCSECAGKTCCNVDDSTKEEDGVEADADEEGDNAPPKPVPTVTTSVSIQCPSSDNLQDLGEEDEEKEAAPTASPEGNVEPTDPPAEVVIEQNETAENECC